ncbi:MAG: ribonuclease P protein component [Ktedonobacterales bacterium]
MVGWHAVGDDDQGQGGAHASECRQQGDAATDGPRARGAERFRREHRLRSPADFVRVRRVGRSVAGPYLSLGYARRERPGAAEAPPDVAQLLGPTRVGFAVGKRVGGAVTRNLVKRRLREAMRRRLRLLTPGWDLVVVARPATATANAAQLADELDRLLRRAKVLASGSEGTKV